jgi:hypothetical protein
VGLQKIKEKGKSDTANIRFPYDRKSRALRPNSCGKHCAVLRKAMRWKKDACQIKWNCSAREQSSKFVRVD